MKKFLSKYPIYLLLFPVFFVFHNYNELYSFVHVQDVLIALLVVSGFISIAWLVSFLFFRSTQKAALCTFLIVVFTVYFGIYHDFMKSVLRNPFLSSYKV